MIQIKTTGDKTINILLKDSLYLMKRAHYKNSMTHREEIHAKTHSYKHVHTHARAHTQT